MRHRKHLLLIVFLFISITSNFAANTKYKPGYIITLNNDTVNGYLLYQSSLSSSARCFFKANLEANAKEYGPEEISGYRFINGKFYISKQIIKGSGKEPKIVFLEFLIQGITSIYYTVDDLGEHYYIEKKPMGLVELSEPERIFDGYFAPSRYKGKLTSIMIDCPDIAGHIEKTDLTYSSLVKLAKEYHNKVCTEYNCIIFESTPVPVKVSYGILFGLSANKYTFGEIVYTDNSPGFELGLDLRIINAIFTDDRFGINIGLQFKYDSRYKIEPFQNYIWNTHVGYNGVDYIINRYPAPYNHSIDILPVDLKIASLKLPVMFDRKFDFKNLALLAGFGITNKIVISSNRNFSIKDFEDQYGRTIPLYMVGGTGKAGLTINTGNNHAMCFNLLYEYLIDPKAINKSLRLREESFTFQFGYIF